MMIRATRQHRSTVGFHLPGDEYEDTKTNAEAKLKLGIVEVVEDKKAAPLENKKAGKPEAPKNKAK